MPQSNSFFGAIRAFFSRKKAQPEKSDISGILPYLPTLGRGEVMLKRSPGGESFDIYTLEKLSKDQLELLSRGEVPEGLTAYYV